VGLTTVIDLTGAEPVVIREGKGDISFLEVWNEWSKWSSIERWWMRGSRV
jgi:hypothetical protein